MRRAGVLIGLACLALSACASTIEGTPAASPGTSSAGHTSGDPKPGDFNSGDPTSADPTGADSTATTPTGRAGPSADEGVPTSSSVLATSSSVQVFIPEDFAPFGYFGYRGVSADATCPQEIPDCVGIEVYSVNQCPPGATVLLDYYKESADPKTFLGEVTGVTPAIDAGGTQTVFIGIPADIVAQGPFGYIQDISC